MNLQQIIGDYQSFLDDIIGRIKNEGFNMADFSQMDHMCYRTTSEQNYQDKKSKLMAVATLLTETEVNGRMICTFRLHKPVVHAGWRVDALELPAPKQGKECAEGLEHVELVLYDDMPTFLAKYEGKPFELQSADRGINPEIGLKLGEYKVKFHLLSLTTVCYLENKLGITKVVDNK